MPTRCHYITQWLYCYFVERFTISFFPRHNSFCVFPSLPQNLYRRMRSIRFTFGISDVITPYTHTHTLPFVVFLRFSFFSMLLCNNVFRCLLLSLVLFACRRVCETPFTVIPQTCKYKGRRFECGLSISCVLAGGKPIDSCSGGMIWSCCVDKDLHQESTSIGLVQNASKCQQFRNFLTPNRIEILQPRALRPKAI